MSRSESFEIKVGGGAVEGTLHLPPGEAHGKPWPAVLICRGIHGQREVAADLFGDLLAGLCDAGMAGAVYEPRPGGTGPEMPDDHGVRRHIDDASAVFRWLALRPDLDLHRLGVVGFSLGAVVVSSLARRTDQIAGVCLVAPIRGDNAVARIAKSNEWAVGTGLDEVDADLLESLAEVEPSGDLAFYDRPTLIVNGAVDQLVTTEISRRYLDGIERAGHQLERVVVALADHSFSAPAARTACVDQIVGFFARMPEPAGARK